MMEIASTNYLPELGMEDPTFFHQYPMDSFACPLDELDFQSFFGSPESYSSYQYFNSESKPNCFSSECPDESVDPARITKKLNTLGTWNWNTTCASDLMPPKASASPTSQFFSFEHFKPPSVASQEFYNLDSDVKHKIEKGCSDNMDFAALISKGTYQDKSFFNYDSRANKVAATRRNPTEAQDHVMAERKRREKLNQRFIALSAMVPGLKKMDKASVLGDAIKYVKQLQERVQTLEEQAAKKTVESAVLVKRTILFAVDDIVSSSSDENSHSHCDQPLPEIEARVSGKDVLIKIHCNSHSGRADTILSELEKHHLTVHSSSFLPFGNNTLDITIVAQMNTEYCMKAKDLLGSLRQALRQFI